MPDTRRHRGPHPEDRALFGEAAWPTLQRATSELSWLLTRGYSEDASLKLVGDHHQLRERQRRAVMRAACTDAARSERKARRLPLTALRGEAIGIDGLNCLITLEAMLSGAPVFLGRDGATRDLASVHGTYRSVEETLPALTALRELLEATGVASACVYLDRPVGNSGRLRALVEEVFAHSPCPTRAELCASVDPVLVAEAPIAASSDGWVLDRAQHWVDLPAAYAERAGLTLWRVPLDVA